MNKMLTLLGEIDQNDLQYVRERVGNPVVTIPAPYIKNRDGSYKQINPHESRFIMEDGKFCSVFHVKPIYYATNLGTWRPLYEVASYYGNKRGMTLKEGWEDKMDFGYLVWYIKRLEAMKSQYGVAVSYPQTFAGIELTPVQIPVLLNASPLTAYPDPHTETNTVDGQVGDSFNNLSWANLIIEPGSTSGDNDISGYVWMIRSTATENVWHSLYRGIFLFLTSSIGSSSTITSATLSLYGSSKADDLSITPNVNIYSSAPASNTALADGDFDSLGATAFSTAITYNSISTSGYNAFALNGTDGDAVGASGIGSIVKDGVSKFGTRNANYDVTGTPPTWASSVNSSCSVIYADTAGTTSDPKLYVEYTAAVSGLANLKSLNTNLKANIKSYNTNLIANVKSINTNV